MTKVIKKGKYISFQITKGFSYDIEIGRIYSKSEGLADWLLHLKQKNWFTPSVELVFLGLCKEIWEEKNGKSTT